MKKREEGFTLVEILVAVLITGIIFSFIYQVLTSSIDNSNEAKARMEVERVGRYFIQRISTDLNCVTLLPMSGSGGLIGRHFTVNGKSRDEVHFTAFAQSYVTVRPPSDQAEVGYYFMTQPDGKESLMRRESDIIEKPVDKGGGAYEITSLVEELTIRYFDGSKWQDSWDTSQSNIMPAMISVELRMDDGKRKYLFTTVVKPLV